VSATTGYGLQQLVQQIAAIARARIGDTETPAISQVRHRQQLERCGAALSAFVTAPMEQIELRAEDLRHASQALGRLTGEVDAEDVLDAIFGRFCIGK
jgi:tRNA modification GTPase